MGPLSRLDLVANLENQLVRSIADGAHIAFRGPSNGCNISPIVLTGVRPGMAAFDEETFGPLAALIIAEDAADAVRLANLSRYGLAASLWSADKEKVKAMVHELEAGNVFVNAVVRSDSRLPFGGIKKSGYGRELSKYGIHEFVNIKTFYIES
jgi:succinate-semialdehyde dehydrogenase/glutarate-semialdehyde dehydrogenase